MRAHANEIWFEITKQVHSIASAKNNQSSANPFGEMLNTPANLTRSEEQNPDGFLPIEAQR